MVRRVSDNGGIYHEPPYTPEEEMDFYQRTGGAERLTIYHSSLPASQSPPQKSPQPSQEAERQPSAQPPGDPPNPDPEK